MRHILLFALVMICTMSCSTTKSGNGNPAQIEEPLISLHKGACFGTCPVYRFTLYPNGDFIYEALRFHEDHGVYSGKVSNSDIDIIVKMTSGLNWSDYPDYIESQIPDLPSTTLTCQGKSVTFREEAPQGLNDLGLHLEELAKRVAKKEVVASPNKEYLANSTIKVKFKVNSHPDLEFQSKWRPVLKSISPIVDEERTYSLICNSEKISIGEVIYGLSKDPAILSISLK